LGQVANSTTGTAVGHISVGVDLTTGGIGAIAIRKSWTTRDVANAGGTSSTGKVTSNQTSDTAIIAARTAVTSVGGNDRFTAVADGAVAVLVTSVAGAV